MNSSVFGKFKVLTPADHQPINNEKLLLVTPIILLLAACDTPRSECKNALSDQSDPDAQLAVAFMGLDKAIDFCVAAYESQ